MTPDGASCSRISPTRELLIPPWSSPELQTHESCDPKVQFPANARVDPHSEAIADVGSHAASSRKRTLARHERTRGKTSSGLKQATTDHEDRCDVSRALGRTGGLLWRASVGGQINAGAMSYSVNGKQYVAIAAGNGLFAYALAPNT